MSSYANTAPTSIGLDPPIYVFLAVQALRVYTEHDMVKEIEVIRLLFDLRPEPDTPFYVLSATQTLRNYAEGETGKEAEVIQLILTGEDLDGHPLPTLDELLAWVGRDPRPKLPTFGAPIHTTIR